MRKTRVQKEKTALRKEKKQLKDKMEALDNKIVEEKEQISSLEQWKAKIEKASTVLKNFCLVCLGATVLAVAVGLGTVFGQAFFEDEMIGETNKIVNSEIHNKHKQEKIENFYQEYKEGNISSSQFVDKIEKLDSREYIEKNYQSEGIKKAREKIDSCEDIEAVAGLAGCSFVGVGGIAIGASLALEKKGKKKRKQIDKKIGDLVNLRLLRNRYEEEYKEL